MRFSTLHHPLITVTNALRPVQVLLPWVVAATVLVGAESPREIDDIPVPTTEVVEGQALPLRGADLLRWNWVVKIYVAACWLPLGTTDPVTATPKRFAFTYRRAFRAEDLAKATAATIVAGHDEVVRTALATPLAAWNAAYRDVTAGDRLTVDHLSDGTAIMALNGTELVRLTDPTFAKALAAIWVGPHTFDEDLRTALTGG